MDESYECITAAAIEAIQAIVAAPANSVIFLDDSAKIVASCVYFSWADYVGGVARQEDIDTILYMLEEMG